MPKFGRVETETHGRVRPTQPTPVRILSATKSTTTLTLNFDQPVVLKGTPNYTTDLPGVTALSATTPSIDSVRVTFSASIATATELTIPFVDPGVRSKDGGFVADSTFPL